MSGGATGSLKFGAWRRVGGRAKALAGTVAVLAASTLVRAADDNRVIYPSGSGHASSPAGGGSGMANTITLVVALVFAAVGLWVFLRNRRAPGLGRDSRLLAVDETRSLGNRQYLVVASYDGKKFLLGVCPGRIDLLSALNERGPEKTGA